MSPSQSRDSPEGGESAALQLDLLTLFPEVIEPYLSASLFGRARLSGSIRTRLVQIRDFARDKHRTVDDTPFGGGEGMVMRADVLLEAWRSLVSPQGQPRTILLSPQGRVLDSRLARELAGQSHLILVCGHYEGVDERFVESVRADEISIGDYVLTGGELPALVLADAVARFVPGVVGSPNSVEGDSFEGGLLKYPQYTRPRSFEGREVPAVLLSGDHGKIADWRREQREARTQARRPDLWERFVARKGNSGS